MPFFLAIPTGRHRPDNPARRTRRGRNSRIAKQDTSRPRHGAVTKPSYLRARAEELQTPSPMTDITTRLRQTRADMIGTDDEQHYWDCHDAAAEIERLRAQPCPYVAGTVTHYCTLAPLTLTDAEREALASVLNRLCGEMTQDERQTLIGLLERMGKPTESE